MIRAKRDTSPMRQNPSEGLLARQFAAALERNAVSEQPPQPIPGDAEEEGWALDLLTSIRDWALAALAHFGASTPTLPIGPIRTREDAFQLFCALEPVADELDAVDAAPALRDLARAAAAAAHSGSELGARPAGERSGDRDPRVELGRHADEVLVAWAALGRGDPVRAAEQAVIGAAITREGLT